MAKIVTMTIDENGDPTVDLDGYKGKGCAAVQEVFGRALGKTEKVTRKPEYNAIVATTKIKAGGK